MAKRRLLKKNISYVIGDLFAETLICKLLIPGIDKKKADALMTRILDLQDEYIRRVNHPDGKENKSLIKAHYHKLREELQNEIDTIEAEIKKLSKESASHSAPAAPKAEKETAEKPKSKTKSTTEAKPKTTKAKADDKE